MLRPDCLQQQAVNRASIRTTRLGAGVDCIYLLCPHPAAIDGTLPCYVAEARRLRADIVRVFDRTEEVGNDLDCHPKDIRKEGSFGPSIVDRPGRA
jgi:hypothetical protein